MNLAALPFGSYRLDLPCNRSITFRPSSLPLGIALFGSQARGDQGAESDVDLLLLTDQNYPDHEVINEISISYYPYKDMILRCKSGDLFACHIAMESCILWDPKRYIENCISIFLLKDSYCKEISDASDLAWFIVDFYDTINDKAFINRRISWCVRTILISKSANARSPIFSSVGLASYSNFPRAIELIKAKNERSAVMHWIDLLKQFMEKEKLYRPFERNFNADVYYERFISTRNQVGLKTFQQTIFPADGYV